MAEKVAIIHDWLNGMRGGEKVLEEILAVYPQADIFTLFYDPALRFAADPLQEGDGVAAEPQPVDPQALPPLPAPGSPAMSRPSTCATTPW